MPEITYEKLDPKCTHLRIATTHGKTFRRFGRVYETKPQIVPVASFTPAQLKELLRRPRTFQTARREDAKLEEVMILRVEQLEVGKDGRQTFLGPEAPVEEVAPAGMPPEVMAEIRREFAALEARVAAAEQRAAAAEAELEAAAGGEKPAEKPAGKGKSK